MRRQLSLPLNSLERFNHAEAHRFVKVGREFALDGKRFLPFWFING